MICFIELKGEWSDEQINDLFNLAKEKYDLSLYKLINIAIKNALDEEEIKDKSAR